MWIKEPVTITEHIEFLGRPELCTYLLKGDTYALAGGAMAHVIPYVLTQLNDLNVDVERIRYLILLHTHFDHIGMAPHLAQQWPWLRVAVSGVGAEILKNRKALKVIQDYNNSALATNGLLDQAEPLDIVHKGFPVHYILNSGEGLDLGNGITLHPIDVPGHSVCSTALYFPREYALFPSDSIGSLTNEGILPFGSSNYDDFQESIDRLSKVGAEIICLEHFGVLTPPEGKQFCEAAKKVAKEFRSKIADTYRERGEVEGAVNELVDDFYFGFSKAGLLPEDLLRDIVKRMVTFVNQIG